ncbi:MAG: hypothetical protein ABJB61_08255 [bacterium]
MQKPSANRESDEDSYSPKATFLEDEQAMRESILSAELSSAVRDGGSNTHEMLPGLGSLEVGIR